MQNNNNLTKQQIYRQVLAKTTELGLNSDPVRSAYSSSTKNQLTQRYEGLLEIQRNRSIAKDRVLELANRGNIPILIDLDDNSLSVANIQNELNRIGLLVGNNVFNNNVQNLNNERMNELINNDIRNGNHQQILNKVVSREYKLTEEQADDFLNGLVNLPSNVLIHFTFDKRGDITRPVVESTLPTIKELLIDLNMAERDPNGFGSDVQENIKLSNVTSLRIEIQNNLFNNPNAIINRAVGFYPKLNPTDIDLTKEQIYTQEQSNDLELMEARPSCLINTLIQSGCQHEIVREVRLMTGNQMYISVQELKKIVKNIPSLYFKIEREKTDGFLHKCLIIQNEDVKGISKKEIHCGILSNHMFAICRTIYTWFSIDSYQKVKHFKDFHKLKRLTKGYPEYYKDEEYENKRITNFQLIRIFNKNNIFVDGDMSNMWESHTIDKITNKTYIDNVENEQRDYEVKKLKKKTMKIWDMDTETYVSEYEAQHELKLFMAKDENNYTILVDEGEVRNRKGNMDYEMEKAIKKLTCYGKSDAVVWVHNLKYDHPIIEKYMYITNVCQKEGILYEIKTMSCGRFIHFRDSLKYMNMPLNKIPDTFNLEGIKKEAIAYKYYTKDNYGKIIKIDEYIKFLPESKIEIFKETVKNMKSYNEEEQTFNPDEYYIYYLHQDVDILKKGRKEMNKCLMELTGNQVGMNDKLTISSISDYITVLNGCYDGVCEMTGNLKQFVARAVMGGRVACNPKYTNKLIKKDIADYDGNSLYPSAMTRLSEEYGLPTGMAKKFTSEDIHLWREKQFCFLEIKINKITSTTFPSVFGLKTPEGNIYSNTPGEETIVVSKIAMEDYIDLGDLQEGDYELITGVYYDGEPNKKLGQFVRGLFEKRKEVRANGQESLGTVIKLLMNSIYGKTIMKGGVVKTEVKHNSSRSPDAVSRYLTANVHQIKTVRDISGKKDWSSVMVEVSCLDDSWNRAHIGAAILDMSKRMMNEIFGIANKLDIPILYTDTDSIQMFYDDVQKVSDEYERVYNRVLTGDDLGQFHIDFKLKGAVSSTIKATNTIIIDKKVYYNTLTGFGKQGDKVEGHHIRMKGVTQAGIDDAAAKNGGPLELYHRLALGQEIEFILNPYDADTREEKIAMKFENGTVRTLAPNTQTRSLNVGGKSKEEVDKLIEEYKMNNPELELNEEPVEVISDEYFENIKKRIEHNRKQRPAINKLLEKYEEFIINKTIAGTIEISDEEEPIITKYENKKKKKKVIKSKPKPKPEKEQTPPPKPKRYIFTEPTPEPTPEPKPEPEPELEPAPDPKPEPEPKPEKTVLEKIKPMVRNLFKIKDDNIKEKNKKIENIKSRIKKRRSFKCAVAFANDVIDEMEKDKCGSYQERFELQREILNGFVRRERIYLNGIQRAEMSSMLINMMEIMYKGKGYSDFYLEYQIDKKEELIRQFDNMLLQIYLLMTLSEPITKRERLDKVILLYLHSKKVDRRICKCLINTLIEAPPTMPNHEKYEWLKERGMLNN